MTGQSHNQFEQPSGSSADIFHHIFNLIDDAIFIADSRDLRILDANPAALRMYGYAPEEFTRLNLMDLTAEREKTLKAVELARQNELGPSILRWHKKKSGETFPAEITAVCFGAGEKEILASIVRDVSERRKAEAALEESEMRFRSLSDAAFEGVGITDHSRIIEMNSAMSGIFGYERDELIGQSVERLVFPEDREWVMQRIETGFTEAYEHRALRKDGRMIYVEACARGILYKGKPCRITALRDISERKASEEKLRKTLQASADIVRAIPAGLFIYQFEEPDKLVLIEGNPAAERLTGKNAEEMRGKTFDEIWVSAGKAGITARFLQVARTGIPYEAEDLSYTENSIETFYRLRVFALPGNRLGATFENITERKKIEAQLRRYAQELQDQKKILEQKNLALREIVGHIEHEKNMLKEDIAANVRGFLVPTLQKLELRGTSRHYCDLLKSHLENLASSFGREITRDELKLSSREIEICDMIKGGLSSKEIAGLLNLSVQTVDKHRKNIRRKLGLTEHQVNLVTYLKNL